MLGGKGNRENVKANKETKVVALKFDKKTMQACFGGKRAP